MKLEIRKATENDLPEVKALIQELADFEKEPDAVTITLDQLKEDGFGSNPVYWILVAEMGGQIIGMSFYYIRYSTWKGKCLHLEDLVVKNDYRRMGVGKLLFDATIDKAKEMNAVLMTWQVLDWNESAINFYKKYNTVLDPEWINAKLKIE